MDFNSSSPFPEGVISFLDTDLYKLTMQCAVFKCFREVPVTYAFTNRTPDKKLSRAAFRWLEDQIQSTSTVAPPAEADMMANIDLQSSEISPFLQKNIASSKPTATT